MPTYTGGIFRFGDFEVDTLARSVKRGEKLVPLNRRAFDVLLCFVQEPGRVLSKDELLKNVWADVFVDENSLAQSISVLRRALEDKPGEHNYIVTLPGRGYQFICPVEVLQADGRALVPAPAGGNGGEMAADERMTGAGAIIGENEPRWLAVLQRPVAATLVALVVMAAVGLAGRQAWRHFHPVPPTVRVVVADFENTTGEAEFDHTLQQALRIDLEQSPFLSVVNGARVRETLGEMQRRPDERLTPALAREVCERNNAQAMLHGTLSKVGSDYVLMLEAENCASEKQLASYKAQVSSKEAVLGALDQTVGHVRKQMGESAATRERFQMPVAQATTASLEALRAYSQGAESVDRGEMKAAVKLYERAIALDPNFASAYKGLSVSYYNLNDFSRAAALIRKAFDLRERTSERERLGIEIAYYYYGISDLEAAASSLKLYVQIYPESAHNLGNLCDLYTQLGEYGQAIPFGESARRMDPHSGFVDEVLARAYKRASRFAEAKAVAEASVAEGNDRWGTHSVLFQIAVAEGDAARIESESEWGLSHQQVNLSLDNLGFAAATGGRVREAVDYFERARTESLRGGDRDFADDALRDMAGVLVGVGETARARESLQAGKLKGDAADLGFLEAETGDPSAAQRAVADPDAVAGKNTLHIYYDLPLVRALLAEKAHKPAEAVRLLETARPHQLRDYQVPYLRARAETEAGMLEAAAEDYRLILRNQGVDPISPLYYVSHLGLARVLAMQKKPDAAGAEYRAFLAAWKNADADLPLLIEARQEYAKLGR
jgi:DNA-binding winged helix-turn-helix (wHTH) protein/tetratricopeptide (TPR) repeat protein